MGMTIPVRVVTISEQEIWLISVMKKATHPEADLPVFSKAVLEQERKILLDLANDITIVRDKDDLLALFSKRIKSLFYFTHAIITLIDKKDETYFPFLLDHQN